jgi:hypothetical protein
MAKKKLPPEVIEYFRRQGARGGKIGGKRSLETMTQKQRTARARKAARASVAKKKAVKAAAKKRAAKAAKRKGKKK